VAYAVAANTTGAGESVPTTASFPVAGIVGISLAAAAAAAGGLALWRYRRRRAADSSAQYAELSEVTIAGAMASITVPAGPGGGAGFLRAFKQALAPPPAGGVNAAPGGGGGGGDVYAELPDDAGR
jgi:hypothetical protein